MFKSFPHFVRLDRMDCFCFFRSELSIEFKNQSMLSLYEVKQKEEPSVMSLVKSRIKLPQFNPNIFGFELPIYFSVLSVS